MLQNEFTAAIFSAGIKSFMSQMSYKLKWHITSNLLSYYYVWCTYGNVITWLCNITVLIRKDFLSICISTSENIKILFVIFLIFTSVQLKSIFILLMIKIKEDKDSTYMHLWMFGYFHIHADSQKTLHAVVFNDW